MSVSIEIKIKIILLVAKFESATVVKRKRQSNFGRNAPTDHEIRIIFERFCETGSVEDRSRSARSIVINQEKVDEVNDFLQTHRGSSVRSVAEISSISQTTIYRITTEHLLLKSCKMQFVQLLYEKDFQDRVEMCHMSLPLLTEPRDKSNIFLFE